jgi:hypothetical protein
MRPQQLAGRFGGFPFFVGIDPSLLVRCRLTG